MKKSSLLKLLLLSFALSSCGSVLPSFPEVWQCAYKNTKFYCVNTKTGAKRVLNSDGMQNAQCLSSRDYQKSESWVAAVREIAETRCN